MILITGATGFFGKALVQRLLADDESRELVVALRRGGQTWPEQVTPIVIGDLTPYTDWSKALKQIAVVVHLAARVHVRHDTETDPLTAFRTANVDGTLKLARQAAAAGVKRFVFVSSVKVNGASTQAGRAFSETDVPAPQDAYGLSKHEAEVGLFRLAAATGMEVVIIRPPLAYGPGVKANFLAMIRWLCRRIPLPLGAIHNKRSFVALENLIDFIVTCNEHPAAANQTFLVSDGEDLSTTDLLCRMAEALNVPIRLMPIPQRLVEAGFKMVGKSDLAQRLCGSLQVDISKARTLLDWNPPVNVDEGLRRAAYGFLHETIV